MRVICLIACYYSDYAKKAIHEVCKIANRVSIDNIIVVIDNSGALVKDNRVDYLINGTNLSWEFSAWDEGIAFLEKNITLNDDDLIICANDTLCHHRVFSILNSFLFVKGLKRLCYSSNMLVGEYCKLGNEFEIMGVSSKGWISTYLFGIKFKDLKQLSPFSKCKNGIDVDFTGRKLTIENTTPNLVNHLNIWLFPDEYQHGWYKAKKMSLNKDVIKDKLKAIVNEKLLSAYASKNNIQLIDVYNRFFIKILIKMQNKILK